MSARPFYEITTSDLNKRHIRFQGRTRSLDSVLGYVQRGDIGKRIYDVGDGVLQVENQEQFERRRNANAR